MKRVVVPQLWDTSNGTFVTDRVDNIKIFCVEYSASKKVRLQPDIVEYSPGDQAPMYDLIIGKQTRHNLEVKLDFQERTITIDEILLLGGPQEKMPFFCNASGPILSIPIHSKVCQYDPCKVSLKKNDPFLTHEPPKVSVFLALVTGLVTD